MLFKKAWRSAGKTHGDPDSFAYTYDPLNRLISGVSADGNFAEKGLSYDKNGNILTLNRVFGGNLVDSLHYNYIFVSGYSNQLQTLKDDAEEGSLTGHADETFGYAYDGNGNMTADSSKFITISYNLLWLTICYIREAN